MDERILKIINHPLFGPMLQYLRHDRTRAGQFLDQAAAEDPAVRDLLHLLAQYGAYDILIPLNELMRCVLPKPAQRCWAGWMNRLPGRKRLERMAKRFRSRLRQNNISTLFLSVHRIYAMVWDICLPELERRPQPGHGCNLCGLLPGLHAPHLTADYLKMLEQYLFPALEEAVDGMDTALVQNRNRHDLVCYAVSCCAGELGWQYYCALSSVSRDVLRCSWSELSEMGYQQYRQMLCRGMENKTIAFDPEHEWVRRMEQLCRLADKFRIDARRLEMCLPVLLQCVGRNEDASSRLMEILDKCDAGTRSDGVLLQGIYRALSVEKGKKQQKLYSLLISIVSQSQMIRTAAEVVEDAQKFYKRFAGELELRFDAEGIAALLSQADLEDLPLYQICRKLVPDHVEQVYGEVVWLRDNVFGSGRAVAAFHRQLEIIRSENEPYSVRLKAVWDANALFGCLAGRLDGQAADVRLYLYRTLEILELPGLLGMAQERFASEVFELYTNSQIRQLRILQQRFDEVLQNLPDYVSVIEYEHNSPEDPARRQDEIQLLKLQLEGTSRDIEQLQNSQNALPAILDLLVRAQGGYDPQNSAIAAALAENQEDALALSDTLHALLKNSGKMPAAYVTLLEKLNVLTEYALCSDAELNRQKRKECFGEIIAALGDLIPGIDKIKTVAQLISAIRKLGDTFDPDAQP